MDLLNAGLVAFNDAEDDVDASVRQIDRPKADFRRSASRPAIDFRQSRDVGLGHLRVEFCAGARAHLLLQDVSLDLAVALEGDAIDVGRGERRNAKRQQSGHNRE